MEFFCACKEKGAGRPESGLGVLVDIVRCNGNNNQLASLAFHESRINGNFFPAVFHNRAVRCSPFVENCFAFEMVTLLRNIVVVIVIIHSREIHAIRCVSSATSSLAVERKLRLQRRRRRRVVRSGRALRALLHARKEKEENVKEDQQPIFPISRNISVSFFVNRKIGYLAPVTFTLSVLSCAPPLPVSSSTCVAAVGKVF